MAPSLIAERIIGVCDTNGISLSLPNTTEVSSLTSSSFNTLLECFITNLAPEKGCATEKDL